MTTKTASKNQSQNLTQGPPGLDLLGNLNKDNIFSLGSDFYQQLNTVTTKKEEPSKALPVDNEKTLQLHNILGSFGIQFNNQDNNSTQAKIEEPLDIAVRAKDGIYFAKYDTQVPVSESGTYITTDGNISMHYSANGKYFMTANTEDVIIRNLFTGKDQVLKGVNALALGYSNTSAYFFFIQRVDKDKSNVHIYTSDTVERVFTFESVKYKKENWPYVQFNHEDTICVYQTGANQLQLKKPKENFKHLSTLNLEYMCDHFALSTVKSDPFLVTMTLEKFIGFSKTVSRFEIWSTDDLSTPVISTNLEKAQEAKMVFSPAGTHLLLWVQTTHDETGKSYYGQANLYYFDMRTKAIKIVPTYDGPLHDVAWNPNGMEFVVISGFMPAGSVLFDNLCTPKFEFGKHHKNTIRWSPLSRFLCLAGFGNLAGDIEIWDVYALKKVGQCKAHTAVYCGWSPDGRKIMTGVLFPRLRVDNGIKIFKYNGKLLNSIDYTKSELYEVAWKPGKYEDRPASPEPSRDKPESSTEGETQKPKRLFQPKGSMLSDMLKAGKQAMNGPRVLEPDEDFGRAKALAEKEKNSGSDSDKSEESKESGNPSNSQKSESSLKKQDLNTSDEKEPNSKKREGDPAKRGERNGKQTKKPSSTNYSGPRRAAPNTNAEGNQIKPPDLAQHNPASQGKDGEFDDKAFLNLVMQLNTTK